MEKTNVQKLAKLLKILVTILFACNIVTLFFVPGMSLMGGMVEVPVYANPFEGPARVLMIFALCWTPTFWAFAENSYALVLAVFLLICGVCTAIILWQARRVLDTILAGTPFQRKNGESMKRAAVCCFGISAAALLRTLWRFWYYRSIAPLFTYNALFVPVFIMGGLLCMVMSALFCQATELKEENDLTI